MSNKIMKKQTWLSYFLWWLVLVVVTTTATSSSGAGSIGTPSPTSLASSTTATSAVHSLKEQETHNDESADAASTATATATSIPKDDTTKNTSNVTVLPDWKRALPEALRNKTKTLERILVPHGNAVVEVYVLGTAHVSMDSSRDVRLLLTTIEPDVIFLELCDQRIPMMLSPPPPPPSPSSSSSSDSVNVVDDTVTQENDTHKRQMGWWQRFRQRKRVNGHTSVATTTATLNQQDITTTDNNDASSPRPPRSVYGMAASLLTNVQQDYADTMGVELGGEFRVAYEYWEERRKQTLLSQEEQSSSTLTQNGQIQQTSNPALPPLHMILGDRPLYLTLTRAWESLRLWGKFKLLVGLLISSLQKPNPEELREWMQSILNDDTGDLLTESIQELALHFPTLEQVIIRERDAYMACKLYQTCRQLLMQSSSASTSAAAAPKRYKLVAIVGAGHVQGMCHWLTQGGPPPPSATTTTTTSKKKKRSVEPTDLAKKKTPEQVLDGLVKIKKRIPEEDRQILVHQVMEVNYEMLQSMANEMA